MTPTVFAEIRDRYESIQEDIGRQLGAGELSIAKRVQLRSLRRVNKIRYAFGAEPLMALPKGAIGDAHDCPLARALRLDGITFRVGGSDISVDDLNIAELPTPVVAALDALEGDEREYMTPDSPHEVAAHYLAEEINEDVSATYSDVNGIEEFNSFVTAFDAHDPGYAEFIDDGEE